MANGNGLTLREMGEHIKKILSDSVAHVKDCLSHVSAEDRKNWDGKPSFNNPDDIASDTRAGLISPELKRKLDLVEDRANNYKHPVSQNVVPGTYSRLTVDANGHVVEATNEGTMDVTVQNSKKLDGFGHKDFVKTENGVMIGNPQAPTQDISDSSSSIATTQFVQDLLENKYLKREDLFTISASPPANTKTIWVDTSEYGVAKYYNGLEWTYLVAGYGKKTP